jgi:hypothetical protein
MSQDEENTTTTACVQHECDYLQTNTGGKKVEKDRQSIANMETRNKSRKAEGMQSNQRKPRTLLGFDLSPESHRGALLILLKQKCCC